MFPKVLTLQKYFCNKQSDLYGSIYKGYWEKQANNIARIMGTLGHGILIIWKGLLKWLPNSSKKRAVLWYVVIMISKLVPLYIQGHFFIWHNQLILYPNPIPSLLKQFMIGACNLLVEIICPLKQDILGKLDWATCSSKGSLEKTVDQVIKEYNSMNPNWRITISVAILQQRLSDISNGCTIIELASHSYV